MPPAPPDRPTTNPYHFHAYDFANSVANPPWGLSPPQVTRGGWQFYSLRRDLSNLVAVGLARGVPNITLNGMPGLPGLAQTSGGKRTLVLSFGNQAGAAAITTVVITGGIHAREWIAAEIAYLIAEYLNRNMATPAWGYDCAPRFNNSAPEGETFFGTRRGGEPESGNVQAAMIAAAAMGVGGNIDVAIDYHSYGRMILYPSELLAGGLTAAHQELGRLMDALIVDNAHQGYRLGTGVGLIRYEATGTVADRAIRQHQARSFTIELDPGPADPAGFELDEGQIQTVFETNILGALAAIAAPTTFPAAMQVGHELATWDVHGAGNQLP
jgi:Zinc carboxypeptidase